MTRRKFFRMEFVVSRNDEFSNEFRTKLSKSFWKDGFNSFRIIKLKEEARRDLI